MNTIMTKLLIPVHLIMQLAIQQYARWILRWDGRAVLMPRDNYSQLSKAASNALTLGLINVQLRGRIAELEALSQLSEEEYDPDTGDYYSRDGEQEFGEIDENGRYVELADNESTENNNNTNSKKYLN